MEGEPGYETIYAGRMSWENELGEPGNETMLGE